MIGGYTGDCDGKRFMLEDGCCCNIRINKERMDKALAANTVKIPKGLNREQMREFIVNLAKGIKANI